MKYSQSVSVEPGSWKFWLISTIAFLSLSCSIAATVIGYDLIYDSLEPCGWLDAHFELSSCIQVLTYSHYEGRAFDISFSLDSQMIVAGGIGGFPKIWNVANGELLHEDLLREVGVYGIAGNVAFGPDGIIAFGENHYSDYTLLLADLKDETIFFQRENLSGILDITFTPDGTLLAVATGGNSDGIISLWRVSDGQLLRTFVTDNTSATEEIVFSLDGEKLLEVYRTETTLGLYTWRISDGALLNKTDLNMSWEGDIALSPNGEILALCNCIQRGAINCLKTEITVWQVNERRLLHKLNTAPGYITNLALSPDGTLLASAGGNTDVQLWQIHDGTLLHTLKKPVGSIGALDFSPDGKILAVGGADIILWGIE